MALTTVNNMKYQVTPDLSVEIWDAADSDDMPPLLRLFVNEKTGVAFASQVEAKEFAEALIQERWPLPIE